MDILQQSKIKIQEENSKLKVRSQNLIEQLQKSKSDHRDAMAELTNKIKQLEEHQRSSVDDEILNSPKNKSEHAGGTGSSGQSENAKGSPLIKMVEITNEQVDRLKEINEQSNTIIQQLKSQNEVLEKDKANLIQEKQKAESEKEALKI